MAYNLDQNELIEQYLTNRLSKADMKDFETQLTEDIGLRNEVEFQKEVIDTLKDYRRLDIKSRLSNVPVTSSLIGSFVATSAYFKPLLVASIAGLIGFGVYFANETTEDLQHLSLLQLSSVNDFSLASEFENPAISIAPETAIIENSAPKKAKRPSVARKAIRRDQKANHKKNVANADNKVAIHEPSIDLSVDINHDNVSFEEPVIETVGLEKKESTLVTRITNTDKGDIELTQIVKNSAKEPQYKFSKGKLYLYGDFGEDTYEILEINRDERKDIILILNDEYYELDKSRNKPTLLTPIQSDVRIKEIRILKKVKLD